MSRSQGTLAFDTEFLEAVLGKARKPGADPLVVVRSYAKPPGSSAEYLQVVAPGSEFFSLHCTSTASMGAGESAWGGSC